MTGTNPEVERIEPDDLKARLDRGDALVLLDVREDDERAYAAIRPTAPGVVDLHIPLGQLTSRVGEVEGVADGRAIVVYCHHGVRSLSAAAWLTRRGLSPVANLEGGIDTWSTRIDPRTRRY